MNFKEEAAENLKEYNSLKSSLRRLENKIERLVMSGPKDITAMTYDEVISGGSNLDDMVNIVYEIQVYMQALERTKLAIQDIDSALDYIEAIKPEYKAVLVEHFVNRLDVPEIAEKIKYSTGHVYRFRNEGLRLFAIQFLGILVIEGS